ncbi:uncharacterized protein M6B38_368540 [Iris pallida]|uniref:Uncharacterized protein n=1 Tax=Iris pallida TaxID=29817 RepID=A0AAX6GGD7_IRIPA|nr:uncharacterized protein M6B38_368535 [Iris pallida]KAJ6827375.1 uncharacterized protein M6B38_368540 [Iris pallida]
MCTTPIQVTSTQLVANEIFPSSAVKALLYPGAAVSSLLSNMTIPRWDNILHMYNLTEVKNASATVDLQRLEVLAGSYFAVAGAFIGLINQGDEHVWNSSCSLGPSEGRDARKASEHRSDKGCLCPPNNVGRNNLCYIINKLQSEEGSKSYPGSTCC